MATQEAFQFIGASIVESSTVDSDWGGLFRICPTPKACANEPVDKTGSDRLPCIVQKSGLAICPKVPSLNRVLSRKWGFCAVFVSSHFGAALAANIEMKMAARDEDAARMTRPRRAEPAKGRGVQFNKTITVNRPVQEVFSFWRHLENLPKFMKFVRAVSSNGGNITHWVVTTDNTTIEWDAETIEARPNDVLSWQSLPAANVDSAGLIVFRPAPGNRGTVIKVSLKYAPAGGKYSAKLAKLFGKDAMAIMEDDLFRFKSLIETGEIPTIEGQPRGGL